MSRDLEFAGELSLHPGVESARARDFQAADPGNSSCHEPLGGQVPSLLFGTAGLSQGAGGPAAQPGESAGPGGESGERLGPHLGGVVRLRRGASSTLKVMNAVDKHETGERAGVWGAGVVRVDTKGLPRSCPLS